MAKNYLQLTAKQGFPIAIRRNNPGNLRGTKGIYPGETTKPGGDTPSGSTYYAFENMAYGMRAMIQLLISRIVKGKHDTIAKLSRVYPNPPSNEWMRDVSKYSGISSSAKLIPDKATIKKLTLGIIKKEVGSPWRKAGITASIDAQDFEDGWALLYPESMVA